MTKGRGKSSVIDGRIEDKTASERAEIFRQLLEGVVLPQRRRLLQFRDATWQSAYVDEGYLAEMIASIVTGVPGLNRRGVSRSSGDLADETEVKKGYRVDPNVDFVLQGLMRRSTNSIELDSLPPELRLREIASQLNSNACSVQLLERQDGGELIGGALGRTATRDALQGSKLRLTRGAALPSIGDGESFSFCLRQERGHINFGRNDRSKLNSMLKRRPVLVFYQHDPRGRFQIAVVRCGLKDADRKGLLDRIFGKDPRRKRQIQPYLFPDNQRTELYGSDRYSVANAFQGQLLALATEARDGVDVAHWDPSGALQVADALELMCAWAPPEECPPFVHDDHELSVDAELDRRRTAQVVFDTGLDGYYRDLRQFCQLTATSRNMAFSNLSQHLVSAVTGLRGTRSGARGADLLEPDGAISEVKIATGQPGGDAMDTEDSPRLTLGWAQDKMLSWKRLFAVRIVDEGSGLHVLVHAPTKQTMATFREQVREYFKDRVNNGSGGLQYHALEPFPHDRYGPAGRTLEFVRVGDFASSEHARFAEVPTW